MPASLPSLQAALRSLICSGSRRLLAAWLVIVCGLLGAGALHAASGSWSAAPSAKFPIGNMATVHSASFGQGSWQPKWIAARSSTGNIYVSPTPPTSSSWVQYGNIPNTTGTPGYIAVSDSGLPVVAYTDTNKNCLIYYWDIPSASYKLSVMVSGGVENNGTTNFWVGSLGNDINGNVVWMRATQFWTSADSGATFTKTSDMANFAPSNVGVAFGTNASSFNSAGVMFDFSTAPWGEIFVGTETAQAQRSYDNGASWEYADPLSAQQIRDSSGAVYYPNPAASAYAQTGNDGGATYTMDGDVMLAAGKLPQFGFSSLQRFWRLLPTGQIVGASVGEVDPNPAKSIYAANGYNFLQLSSKRGYTTRSGDTYGFVSWTIPPGNPLNRALRAGSTTVGVETVKWDSDAKTWAVISPAAGTSPITFIGNYSYAASDGNSFYLHSNGGQGSIFEWTPTVTANLRPSVTLKPGSFPLTVIMDALTHVAATVPGNAFTIADDHTPNGSLSYRWSYRGQGTVTFDNPAALNATAYFSNPGHYVLNLAVSDGALSGSMSVMVKVLPAAGGAAPLITAQPANTILTVGSPMTITVAASGTGLHYQWKRNGLALVDTNAGAGNSYQFRGQTLNYSGTSTSQLTIQAGSTADDGAIYHCEISSPYGRVVSNSATVGVAPTIIQGPVDNGLANGDLSVAATGTQYMTWQWYNAPANTAIPGANQSIYHATAAGDYYVKVSNIFGSAISATATITPATASTVTLNINDYGVYTLPGTAKFLAGTTVGLAGEQYTALTAWTTFTNWTSNNANVVFSTPAAAVGKLVLAPAAAGQSASLFGVRVDFVGDYPLTVKNGYGTGQQGYRNLHPGERVVVQAFPAPPGMQFDKWTGADAARLNDINSSLASLILPAAAVEVIASYKAAGAASFTVTYAGNGNTGGSAPVDGASYPQGATVTVLAPGSLVKAGSTFASWNTVANGAGISYAPGATFGIGGANLTLYAQWTAAATHTVTYSGNTNSGGTVPVDAGAYPSGATVTVLPNTGGLVKSGSSFAGWNTVANGSGTPYAATGAATFVMGNANVVLYAQWAALPTWTVSYGGNGNTGGTVPLDATAYPSGATVTVQAGTVTRFGYVFAGWNTAADGGGTNYAAGASFTMGASNVTLYAQWTPDSLALTTSASHVLAGQPVTFSAILHAHAPTGSISFKDGAASIAGCGAVVLNNGGAICSTSSLAVGSHVITATYGGDVNNPSISAASVIETVVSKDAIIPVMLLLLF